MLEILLPFSLFVVVMTGTPGPGNLAMLAMGQSWGYRKALPFLLGTMVGLLSLNILVALGLGRIMAASPVISTVTRVLGLAYIVYLGIKIMRMQLKEKENCACLTLWEGLLVHPLSPKSWAMSLVAYTQFFGNNAGPGQVLLFAGMFLAGQFAFHSLWCLLGAAILRFLRNTAVLRFMNGCVALLMVSSTAWAMFLQK